MLPNLSALNDDGELEFRQLSLDTGMKRVLDAARGALYPPLLKLGRLSSEYEALLEVIARPLRDSVAPSNPNHSTHNAASQDLEEVRKAAERSLKFHAERQLRQLLQGVALERIFVPSYERAGATIAATGIAPEIAERISVGFFQSQTAVLANLQEQRNEDAAANPPDDHRLSRAENAPLPRHRQSGSEKMRQQRAARTRNVRQYIEKDELRTKKAKALLDHFVQHNRDVLVTFARDAVASYLSLPSAASEPAMRLNVDLVLQGVDALNYEPIADVIHMDNEVGKFQSGDRYGRPAAEQHLSSLVASFCADSVTPNRATLTGCGTVIYAGVPVIAPERLLRVVELVKQQPGMDFFTDYEILSRLGDLMQAPTTEALSKFTDDQLQRMGIVATATPPLQWSNQNSVSHHRSPRREEVLAKLTFVSGHAAPRVRAFAAVVVDPDPQFKITSRNRASVTVENVTDSKGRRIAVDLNVAILSGFSGAGMGEDALP